MSHFRFRSMEIEMEMVDIEILVKQTFQEEMENDFKLEFSNFVDDSFFGRKT